MPDKPSVIDRLKMLERSENAVGRIVVTVLALYWGASKGLELNSFWQGVMYAVVPWLGGMLAIQASKSMRGKDSQS